ncbi:unnamed protein product [Prunus armeniaca]
MSGKIGRVTGSESGWFAQSFDVGLWASRCGGDTCPWRLGSAVGASAGGYLLRKSVFLRQGRRRVCRFDAGYARLIMV